MNPKLHKESGAYCVISVIDPNKKEGFGSMKWAEEFINSDEAKMFLEHKEPIGYDKKTECYLLNLRIEDNKLIGDVLLKPIQ